MKPAPDSFARYCGYCGKTVQPVSHVPVPTQAAQLNQTRL